MRIGLLGNPDSVGIADTGNVTDRTSKVGIVELKNISSNVLGLIGDKDNYKIRTRRSGISYQEDNATKQAYADDLMNIESSNYIYYLSDSTSNAEEGSQQGFDMSWNGRKIFVSFGVFDSAFVEWQDQLADKSLTRTADISSSGNYKECSDYTTARPGDYGYWWTNTQNLFWQLGSYPSITRSYYPQVKSIAWSRDGMHLLGGGWTKKRWISGWTTYNQYANTLWAWRQKTVQGSTSPWGMSYIGGHPNNQDHSIVSYGEEPHWCSDNLLCSWTNLPTGLVPPTLIREWAQDVSWNDDGTKLFYLEYVYDDNNDITASIVRECAPTLRDEDGGNQTLDPNPYILGGDDGYGYSNIAGTRATFSGSTYDNNDSCPDERWGGIDPPQFGPSSPAVNVGYPAYSNSWNYIGVQWSEVIYSFCFSRDGKKLYALYVENGDHKVVCHKLSNAWDLLNCPAGYFTLNLGALSDIASYDRKKIRIWKNADILWLFASKNGSNVLKHYQFQQKLY